MRRHHTSPTKQAPNNYPRHSSFLPPTALSKILDLVTSALSAEADAVHADLEADEQETVQHHKQLLELFGFLLQWTISAVEAKAAEKPASTSGVGRGRKGAKPKSKDGIWDSSTQLTTAMDVMGKVLKLKLARIFVTTSERDTFISLFTRPVYLILESEARVKSTTIRMHTFKVLCIAVKHHGHAFGAYSPFIFFSPVSRLFHLAFRHFVKLILHCRRANLHHPEPVVL